MSEVITDTKYIITKSYPYRKPIYGINPVNDRAVGLEIETVKVLPKEFYEELELLVSKYCK